MKTTEITSLLNIGSVYKSLEQTSKNGLIGHDLNILEHSSF